jgi:hypothetical protein
MANVDGMVNEGIAALKAGRKAEARKLLQKAVDLDETNEQGWLWLSACVDSLEDQQLCLENVLALNPGNAKAKRGLEEINKQLQRRSSSFTPAPPPASQPSSGGYTSSGSVSPFGDEDFFNFPASSTPAAPPPPANANPWDDSFFDFPSSPGGGSPTLNTPASPAQNAPQNAPAPWDDFDGFNNTNNNSAFGNGAFDTNAPATSVDWGRGNAPAYGSGQADPQPSNDEYDSWMANLPIQGNSSGGVFSSDFDMGPFSSPTVDDPFSNTVSNDPFKKSSAGPSAFDPVAPDYSAYNAPADDDAFGSGPFSAPAFSDDFSGTAGGDDFNFDTFTPSSTNDPFGGSSPFGGASSSEFDYPATNAPIPGFDEPDEFSNSSAFANNVPSAPGVAPARPTTSGGSSSGRFSFKRTPQNDDVFGGAPAASGIDLDVNFDIDDNEEFFRRYAVASTTTSTAGAFKGAVSPANYRGIPEEITAGRSLSVPTLLTVIVLLLLNAASIGFLVMNLMNRGA